jgi:hypothetical protein
MDVKGTLTTLANEYGHGVVEIYCVDPENGFDHPSSRPFYHMTTRMGGVIFHIHAEDYDGTVKEFKRQTTCPSFPPAVGEGMSGGWGGDCYSYTVTAVSASGKTVTVKEDRAKQTGDYFGSQKWEVTEQGVGREETARWSEKRQRYVTKSGMRLTMGRRWAQDPSF